MTVEGGRRWFHLPYVHAAMSMTRHEDAVDYVSRRTDRGIAEASFTARYRPTGPVELAAAGSLEAWLTDRARLFAVRADGRIERTEIRHAPWPLQPAEADIDGRSMAAAHGLRLPDEPPYLRYARRLDVRAWWPRLA